MSNMSFRKNDWVCFVSKDNICSIEKVWIVDEIDDNNAIVCQWRNQQITARQEVSLKDIRHITFNEFIRILTNRRKAQPTL